MVRVVSHSQNVDEIRTYYIIGLERVTQWTPRSETPGIDCDCEIVLIQLLQDEYSWIIASGVPHQVEHAVVRFAVIVPVCSRKVVLKFPQADVFNAIGITL